MVARSRAGMILTLGALFGAFLLIRQGQRATNGMRPTWLLVGAASLAVALSMQFSLYRALDRFAIETAPDGRVAFARNTTEAAKTFMPFGAGVGSFVPVYATFEKPQDLMSEGYANHAHDDFLEIWLETGAAGLILSCFLSHGCCGDPFKCGGAHMWAGSKWINSLSARRLWPSFFCCSIPWPITPFARGR